MSPEYRVTPARGRPSSSGGVADGTPSRCGRKHTAWRGGGCGAYAVVSDAAFAMQDEAHGLAAGTREPDHHVACFHPPALGSPSPRPVPHILRPKGSPSALGIELTPGREQALRIASSRGEMRRADLVARGGSSLESARKALLGLERAGAVRRDGSGRGVRYVPVVPAL